MKLQNGKWNQWEEELECGIEKSSLLDALEEWNGWVLVALGLCGLDPRTLNSNPAASSSFMCPIWAFIYLPALGLKPFHLIIKRLIEQ
ncbi:unnamed protein product [Gongylonema pulchrum]|uniref:Transmembrane protein n=1 Tax=Gongylonema pulchrum TaxID=637853 RepID=A0A183DGM9_9BILA|nr:unnamed protein product [Gongylonema pulchrum]